MTLVTICRELRLGPYKNSLTREWLKIANVTAIVLSDCSVDWDAGTLCQLQDSDGHEQKHKKCLHLEAVEFSPRCWNPELPEKNLEPNTFLRRFRGLAKLCDLAVMSVKGRPKWHRQAQIAQMAQMPNTDGTDEFDLAQMSQNRQISPIPV